MKNLTKKQRSCPERKKNIFCLHHLFLLMLDNLTSHLFTGKGHNNIYIYMVSSQMGQSHDGSLLSDSDHYWWMPDNYTVSIWYLSVPGSNQCPGSAHTDTEGWMPPVFPSAVRTAVPVLCQPALAHGDEDDHHRHTHLLGTTFEQENNPQYFFCLILTE